MLAHLSGAATYNPARFDFLRLTPGGRGAWGDVQFSVEPPGEPVHAWFVYEGVDAPQTVLCPPQNVVLVTAEPSAYKRYRTGWLRRFGHVITCQAVQAEHPRKTIHHSGLPWLVGLGYDQLLDSAAPRKTKRMSVICSRKCVMAGHARRLRFVRALERRFGDRIDFFGRGTRPLDDKWDGLADYEYSVAIENAREPAYWTEKISDCLVAATVPLYYGAPNITDYFPERSVIAIDIEDREQSFATIERLLDESDYAPRAEALRKAKASVLGECNLFRVLTDFVGQLDTSAEPEPVTVVPEPRLPWIRRRWMKLKRRYLGRV